MSVEKLSISTTSGVFTNTEPSYVVTKHKESVHSSKYDGSISDSVHSCMTESKHASIGCPSVASTVYTNHRRFPKEVNSYNHNPPVSYATKSLKLKEPKKAEVKLYDTSSVIRKAKRKDVEFGLVKVETGPRYDMKNMSTSNVMERVLYDRYFLNR